MGTLTGFKIVEIAGIGPGQFCGMLLADMGAQVIRLERNGDAHKTVGIPAKYNLMNRSRPSVPMPCLRGFARALWSVLVSVPTTVSHKTSDSFMDA